MTNLTDTHSKAFSAGLGKSALFETRRPDELDALARPAGPRSVSPITTLHMNGCEVQVVRSYDPTANSWPALAFVVIVQSNTDEEANERPRHENGAVVVTVSAPHQEGNGSFDRGPDQVPSLIHRVLEDVTEALTEAKPPFAGDDDRVVNRDALASFDRLTTKERQILGRLMDGLSIQLIANELGISVSTARSHVQGILQKLHVANQLSAVVMAYKAGWTWSLATARS